jgi:hypothetical protein
MTYKTGTLHDFMTWKNKSFRIQKLGKTFLNNGSTVLKRLFSLCPIIYRDFMFALNICFLLTRFILPPKIF